MGQSQTFLSINVSKNYENISFCCKLDTMHKGNMRIWEKGENYRDLGQLCLLTADLSRSESTLGVVTDLSGRWHYNDNYMYKLFIQYLSVVYT